AWGAVFMVLPGLWALCSWALPGLWALRSWVLPGLGRCVRRPGKRSATRRQQPQFCNTDDTSSWVYG
ncbi:TPA: hypothetical protein ACTW34_003259, partial [Raoultella planticola]